VQKRQYCCARTEIVAGHGDAHRRKPRDPRSKPRPRTIVYQAKKEDARREGESERRPWGRWRRRSSAGGRRPRSSTPWTASSSPLAPLPFLPRSRRRRLSAGERETRRGRGFEGNEEREGGAGKATTTWETARASSGKKERGGRGAREDGAGSPVPGPYGGSGAFVDVILIRTVPCRHRRRWWTAALVRGGGGVTVARAHQAGSWTEPRVPLPRGRAGEEVCGARRAYGAFATCHFVRPPTRHQGFHAKFISIFSTQNSVKMSS
jgi:hypothetical protein